MGYPTGPLLQALAERVLANLELIEQLAPKRNDPDQNRSPYSNTQLLISLLSVLVFPQERAPEALGDLLKGYQGLENVVTIKYTRQKGKGVELTGVDGTVEIIDPTNIRDLPRLLRNSIAHFNIRPIKKGDSFGGVRVWNKDDDDQITLVADIDFDALRPLAQYILTSLAAPQHEVRLRDPEDPLEILKRPAVRKGKRRPPPKISDAVWEPMLAARGGDYDAAKTDLDRLLAREVKQLKAQQSSK